MEGLARGSSNWFLRRIWTKRPCQEMFNFQLLDFFNGGPQSNKAMGSKDVKS
jgi:hypothetical protein